MKTAVALTLAVLAVAPAASAKSMMLFGFGAKKEQLTCAIYNTPAGSGKLAVANVSSNFDSAGRAAVSAKVDLLNNGAPYLKGVKALLVVTTTNGKRYLSGKYVDSKGKVLYMNGKTFISSGVWSNVDWQPANLIALRSQCLIQTVK